MERDKEIINVNIDEIIPNRFQPRLSFEPEALKELSESIKQYGIFQPLVVRKLGNKYEIIAGERRYKAATMAGFKEVPCISVVLDDNESAEIALVENLQRRDLTPIEEAKSYKKLLDRGYINQSQLAVRMGKSQSALANKIRLLNLAEEVQEALLEGKISERHARSLLAVKDIEKQKELLNKIIKNRMTVKDTDLEVKKMDGNTPKKPDFIPIKEEMPPIETTENNNDNLVQNDDNNIIDEIKEDIDIEKLTSSTHVNSKKPDIMDLLKVSEVKPEENTENSIAKISGEDLPITEEQPINNIDALEKPEQIISQEIISSEKTIPFIGEEKEVEIEYDDPQQQQEEIEEEIVVPSNNTYVTNNLRTSINTVRDCVKTLEKFGFSIDKEELDLQDSYQIIIKIAKTDE